MRNWTALSLFVVLGCNSDVLDVDDNDASAAYSYSACEEAASLVVINEPTTSWQDLKAQGVHTRAAKKVVAERDAHGPFPTLAAVDEVKGVGPKAMEALIELGDGTCAAPALPCAEQELLDYVNDASTSAADLKDDGLHSRAANNIVDARNGTDGQPGTGDDVLFVDMASLDAVSYVGPVALEQLTTIGEAFCLGTGEVIMSPQYYDDSHLARAVEEIDAAQRSIDVAMYSFSDNPIREALARAHDRGVAVRFLFDTARDDRKDPAGSRSAALEDRDIEVRWVNKIMHHKFALIDGPKNNVGQAADSVIVTGSGNWSYSAATKYDENTAIVAGDDKLALLFQREFDLMWNNSRPVVWNESITPVPSGMVITDTMIDDASGSDAVFTSANFRTYVSSIHGPTFAYQSGNNTVSDELVRLIGSATSSIDIASGHMRSEAIAQALADKRASDPNVKIRVYLDGQEYTSRWYYENSDGYYGLFLHDENVDVRFKYYAYRWDYTYAEQMHHKTLIVDKTKVATGSYNYSKNAEQDTFENLVIYDAGRYPDMVADYNANFESIWNTGTTDFPAFLDEVQYGSGDVPLIFEPMALDWDQVTFLKNSLRIACPDVDSTDYREDPGAHATCPR